MKLDGHEALLNGMRLDPEMETAFRELDPDVVGLTGYTCQLPLIHSLADRLKALKPEAAVLVGGHHATVRPEEFNRRSVDLVVISEGVFSLREILQRLTRPRGLEDVRGLGIPGEGTVFTEPRPYTPLDELPLSGRSLTARRSEHYFNERLKPLGSISTFLGCTARCNFCALWEITRGRYMRRLAEAMIEELVSIEVQISFLRLRIDVRHPKD